MNALAREYHDKSRPLFCAHTGLVDEAVPSASCVATSWLFAGAASPATRTPKSICPHHQMILRIRGYGRKRP
jgi:glutaconyl-CoA decarboxylase